MQKKFTLLWAGLFVLVSLVGAQSKKTANLPGLEHLSSAKNFSPGATREKCGFAEVMNEARANGFSDARYEKEIQRLINVRRQASNFGPPTTIYTLPVIFHISYDGNTESAAGTGANLSQARINAQIDQLNKDFANLSGSGYTVAEDMGVRFVAAKVDPAGNLLCEPGIDRINWRSRTGWLDPTSIQRLSSVNTHYRNIVKPQSIWDPYQYLNIWIGNFEESTLLGIATFPAQSTLSGLDNTETDLTAGVVVLSGTVGSSTVPGTAVPYQNGKTLTHELGHFFGLRHITGDANCGDDYCTDTPPQDDLTGGCPTTGSLNNCIPSVPKMFENYMDYSNDACLNTFTLNQSERCQVVMLNSPRRVELTTSTKGNSPLSNGLILKSLPGTIAEAATGACPRYKDYPITVGVNVSASGNATLSLVGAGTAIEGADYVILPPMVTYTNGETADKTFTLRVFDDAIIEGSETVNLSLNISGTGVQLSAGCTAQVAFTITDSDNILEVNNTTPVITLLSEDFGAVTGGNEIPAGWVLSSTSANKWVGNSADAAVYGFTGNTLHISDGNQGTINAGTAPIRYDIDLASDARASTPILNAAGLKNIAISLKLVCNGEADNDGVYDFGLIYYSLDGINFTLARKLDNTAILQEIGAITPVTVYLPPATVGTNSLRILFRWLSDDNIGTQPPFAIDDVVIIGSAITVETQLNHSSSEILVPGTASTSFYSTNDEQIIAQLRNSSAVIGCVTANIQNQGTALTSISTAAGTYLRSEKIISVLPAVANNTASYQATFYFTTAELTAWGADVANLKLMRVQTGVGLSGTLTAAEAQVVPAVVSDQRALKGYATFTGDFTGGFAFSQYFLVSPTAAVPVRLTRFEAQATSRNIVLTWTTSMENNNKGFVIERSVTGTDFEKIGWVEGKSNSTVATSYDFADNFVQQGVLYYYRLRQTDLDGRQAMSGTRQAKMKGTDFSVSISPNPAKGFIKVFTGGYGGQADVNLLNAKGQLIRSWTNINTAFSPRVLQLGNIPAGIYLVQVKTPNATTTQRIIIQ